MILGACGIKLDNVEACLIERSTMQSCPVELLPLCFELLTQGIAQLHTLVLLANTAHIHDDVVLAKRAMRHFFQNADTDSYKALAASEYDDQFQPMLTCIFTLDELIEISHQNTRALEELAALHSALIRHPEGKLLVASSPDEMSGKYLKYIASLSEETLRELPLSADEETRIQPIKTYVASREEINHSAPSSATSLFARVKNALL